MKIKRSIILAAIIVALGSIVTCTPKFIFSIYESRNLGLFSSYQPVMQFSWLRRVTLFFPDYSLWCFPAKIEGTNRNEWLVPRTKSD